MRATRSSIRPAGVGSALFGLVTACLLMSACTEQPATDQAVDVRRLFYVILGLATFVFIVVEGILLWSIVRYRRRAGDDAEPPQRSGSTKMLVGFFAFGAILVA